MQGSSSRHGLTGNSVSEPISWDTLPYLLAPLILYWLLVLVRIPDSLSQYFHRYSIVFWIAVLALYYASFRAPGKVGMLLPLSLTMVLLALTLSYRWNSGFSDNFLIGGLLPYKDAKNYYLGANLLLDGLPMIKAGQATERPLFAGFLATLLWISGQNLKITLGIVVQFAGLGIYLSARQVRRGFGAAAGALLATLLYFYIQPLAGYALSELLGFVAGCLGFTTLWLAARRRSGIDLLLGVAILLVGVSARAGAFLVFPMLVLWAGWIFRGAGRFSLQAAAFAFAAILGLFLLINTVYGRLLGVPPGSAFGNFSYALYGQVRGGTGWHSAIEEVGTRNPTVVYQAAFSYFRRHPLSLFIGFAKAYRDFFLPGDRSIFPLSGGGWEWVINLILWIGLMALLVRGLVYSSRNIHSDLPSLLLAGFIGIFLSIPFLPPIDGGSRFHAGTVPFFLAPIAAGSMGLFQRQRDHPIAEREETVDGLFNHFASWILLMLVVLLPVLLRFFSAKPSVAGAACPADQQPFVIEQHPASYVDLVSGQPCGPVPRVCLGDFESNNVELATDDFYQFLIAGATSDPVEVRLIPAINLIDDKFHYIYLRVDQLENRSSSQRIAGCAVEIQTKDQSVFQVKSVFPNGK